MDVVLVLVIDPDGSVRSASVATGPEPFASAAVAASSGWKFAPATRDGKPIPAKIKAQIRFKEPPPPAPPPPPPSTPASPARSAGGAPLPPAPAPAAPPALDVTVHGELPAPGVQSFTRAEVRLLPGAFGDPFRAVDALPGVTPLASGVPFFYVRGAPPGNVGYFLDGIRVPLLYHIGLGPSVVHPAIMDRVDLYPGGYPAEFGRYAGGIVAGETKEPAHELHGELNVRLVDAGAMIEAPLTGVTVPFLTSESGVTGTFFAAGRYSYTGLLLSVISSSLSLTYWDYQTRVSLDLGPRDTLTIFAFGAHDFLGQKDENDPDTTTLFNTTFHRIDVRYDHRFGGPDDRIRQAVTFGYDETSFDKGSFAGDHLVGSRTEITRRLGDTVLLRGGLDAQLDGYQADLHAAFPDATAFTSLFSNRITVTTGVHADAVIQLGPRLELTPGVRLDLYEEHGAVAVGVDPRLAARVAVTKDIRLVTAHGLASQPPSFILPGPGFTRDLTGGLQRAWQESLGVEADLPWDVSGTFTVFRDAFFDMTDALGSAPVPTGGGGFPTNFDQRVDGSSIGLEVLLRRRLTRRLGGLISYTLSRSTRILPTGVVPSSFDRTHVLNVAGTYDFGRGFKAGTRIVFYTGFPVNPAVPAAGRIPPFGRFDARLEKKWSVASGRGWVSLVLEGENVFGAKETLQEQCVSVTAPCKAVQIGPVSIPSIGVEGGF